MPSAPPNTILKILPVPFTTCGNSYRQIEAQHHHRRIDEGQIDISVAPHINRDHSAQHVMAQQEGRIVRSQDQICIQRHADDLDIWPFLSQCRPLLPFLLSAEAVRAVGSMPSGATLYGIALRFSAFFPIRLPSSLAEQSASNPMHSKMRPSFMSVLNTLIASFFPSTYS